MLFYSEGDEENEDRWVLNQIVVFHGVSVNGKIRNIKASGPEQVIERVDEDYAPCHSPGD